MILARENGAGQGRRERSYLMNMGARARPRPGAALQQPGRAVSPGWCTNMGEFVMPTLGADMSAGTLTAWRKQPGDAVKRGDIVAVVETDKADIEIEVFTSGG